MPELTVFGVQFEEKNYGGYVSSTYVSDELRGVWLCREPDGWPAWARSGPISSACSPEAALMGLSKLINEQVKLLSDIERRIDQLRGG